MHPTNNFCRTFGTRAELIALSDLRKKREAALEIARATMLSRSPTLDQLTAACETLTHYGDHADAARAEMLRARIRRDFRAAATPLTQGGAA